MNIIIEHNNVSGELLAKVEDALKNLKPFALKSPAGVIKFFNPKTLQTWHNQHSLVAKNIEMFKSDLSFSMYRFKEFLSIEQIKSLPNAPKQITGR